ncbi:LysR family transcriptional regulator [Lentilactobacillus kisonensis]|uniref:Transcriptional regulator, LysR family n=2 Tax=Lentilactobacillus kisonensis TaxID=481722 RepID=H1LKQ2_9LACO|nr:LysR family transcriptional regulator [Lentilactobacillus kisonensis]EHO46188.1 transcriptional regulator, LysR family [Lentilactobacillus kisonensis F0435]KRL22485.1 transcriptional regulator, LysR family [Lentilactobacillus kisonensis DSM 19906 = JCM 15041]
MNSKLLSFLEEIKAQGNMSKAAQALFVTQPYISRVIKNAEVNFGVKLIDRSSHPIQLTYAGDRLLAYLQEENRLRSNLDREMTHLSQFKYGHLTIASNEVVTNDLYKPVLVRFYNKYPNIHAQITRMTSRDAEKRLLSGTLDFFIGHALQSHKVDYQPAARLPLVLIIPKTSKLFVPGQLYTNYEDLDLTKLSGESFIGTPPEDNYQRLINSYFSDVGITPEYSIEVPDLHLASDLAIEHVGAIVTPEPFAGERRLTEDQKAGINIVKIPTDVLTANFGISYIKNKQTSEPVTDLLDIITEYVDEYTPKR